jgi:hypothetical protein
MDVLRRSARKSRLERIKNEHIKEIMGVKEKLDIIDIIERKRLQWYGHVKRMQEERIPKLIMEWKKKRTSKKNVDGRCTSSHENKTFGSRPVVKQKGIVSGFRKTATAVIRPERKKRGGMVKQSRNWPGVTQRVPGGLGSQIFMTFNT